LEEIEIARLIAAESAPRSCMMIARAAKQVILAWHQQISDWHGWSTAGPSITGLMHGSKEFHISSARLDLWVVILRGSCLF
jgi:hypothetical protein